MKTTNQFDYPTAAATTYKAYKEQGLTNSNKDQQAHYKQVIKQSGDMERNKVKMSQQRKKDIQNQEQQNRIREEILRKKRELEQLEKKKEEAIENQRRAAELAKIKEEEDRIKMIEKQQKSKENEQNAQFRFKDALRRLEAQREENAFQERWAQQRRRANQDAEKVGRQQAIKFKDWQREKEMEEKEMALEEEQRQIQMMRNGLGRCGLNKAGLDYSKTCLHNPNMIFKNTEVSETALERGQNEEKRQQELQQEKKERLEEGRKRSLERGENALQRLLREREYQAYKRETEQQQIQYNLQRIQEGKRNQYVGVKPLTLAQMESNKKLRGQQEFQNRFLTSQVAVHQDPASKYMIIQTKYPHTESSRSFNASRESYPEFSMKQSGPHNYLEEEAEEEEEEEEERPQSLNVQPMRIVSKPMAQTRAEDVKPQRQDLYYSQSEEDSQYP